MRIFCPVCREAFKENDGLRLDEINTLTHAVCYTNSPEFIIDRGSYMDFIEKYPIFQEKVH